VQVQKISILPPQKGLEFPGGVGGSERPKNLKKCVKLYWNFQRGWGGGVLEKIPSGGEVWIFTGTTDSIKNGCGLKLMVTSLFQFLICFSHLFRFVSFC